MDAGPILLRCQLSVEPLLLHSLEPPAQNMTRPEQTRRQTHAEEEEGVTRLLGQRSRNPIIRDRVWT